METLSHDRKKSTMKKQRENIIENHGNFWHGDDSKVFALIKFVCCNVMNQRFHTVHPFFCSDFSK